MAGSRYMKEETVWMDAFADDEVSKDVSVAIDADPEEYGWRMLHRVLPELRERKKKKHIYEPVMLSLGPYHHGRLPHSDVSMEQLKEKAREVVCGATDKAFLLRRISERLDEIRSFYGGADGHGDEELGEMMIRDTCFVLWYIAYNGGAEDYYLDFDFPIYCRLGTSGLVFVLGDTFMVENQIPFWLVRMLFSLLNVGDRERDGKFRKLICGYLSFNKFGDNKTMKRLPWNDEEEEPLHLLEALRCSLIEKGPKRQQNKRGKRVESPLEWANSPFRSVTALKEKGIHLGPSSHCLRDIQFHSLSFYGKLKLPVFFITNDSFVFFSNAIAFEMSPNAIAFNMSPDMPTDFEVTSYFGFMKTLLETVEDVKELRRKRILYSSLASDEEVLRMFKGIDTYGLMSSNDYFHDLKMKIDKHCSSRGKTWLAELLHTYFHSPWTAIALFATISLLCLSFLQTYYTIIQSHDKKT